MKIKFPGLKLKKTSLSQPAMNQNLLAEIAFLQPDPQTSPPGAGLFAEEEPQSEAGFFSRFLHTLLRHLWWPWQKEKLKELSGSANTVYEIQHRDGKTGYFKPDAERINEGNENSPLKPLSNMSVRSVLSSDVDQTLGFNVLARESFCSYQGKPGSESEAIPGESIATNRFDIPVNQEQYRTGIKSEASLYQIKKKLLGRSYFKFSRTTFNHHDFSHPATQKSLANIQLEDAITGQRDRHGGNIKIDDATPNSTHIARGYDNDLIDLVDLSDLRTLPHLHRPYEEVIEPDEEGIPRIVKRKKVLTPEEEALRAEARQKARQKINNRFNGFGTYRAGLPSFIDEDAARRIVGLKAQAFIDQLLAHNPEIAARLDPGHLQELKDRYSTVRRYVKEGLLPSDQRPPDAPIIVSPINMDWGPQTFHAQVSEYDRKGVHRSYLQRSVRLYSTLAEDEQAAIDQANAPREDESRPSTPSTDEALPTNLNPAPDA